MISRNDFLIKEALRYREAAYCPYSHFAVGAALLGASGNIYGGCNVESVSYSPTVCAERTALCKAISEGESEFVAIAIVGGKEGEEIRDFCLPCGVCRQMLAEFCTDKFEVICIDGKQAKTYTLGQLLPEAFKEI